MMGEEMAQLAKCSLQKMKTQIWISGPCKSQIWQYVPVTLLLGGWSQVDPWGLLASALSVL